MSTPHPMSQENAPVATPHVPTPPSPPSRVPYVITAGCGCFLLVCIGVGVVSGFAYFIGENVRLQSQVAESRAQLRKAETESIRWKREAETVRRMVPAPRANDPGQSMQIQLLEKQLHSAREATAQAERQLRALGLNAQSAGANPGEMSAVVAARLLTSGDFSAKTAALKWIQQQDDLPLNDRTALAQAAMSRIGYDPESNLLYEEVIRAVASKEMAFSLAQQLPTRSNARPAVLPLLGEYKDPATIPAILLSLSDRNASGIAKKALVSFGVEHADDIKPYVLDSTHGQAVRDVLAAWKLDPHTTVLEQLERLIHGDDRRNASRHRQLLTSIPVKDDYRESMNRVIAGLFRDLAGSAEGPPLLRKWSHESLWKLVLERSDMPSWTAYQRQMIPVLLDADTPSGTRLLYMQASTASDNEKALEALITRDDITPIALEDVNSADARRRNTARALLRTLMPEPALLVKRSIADLRGPVEAKHQYAMQTLATTDVIPELQSDVVDALDSLTEYTSSSYRGELIDAWARWHTPKRQDVSVKLCQSRHMQLNEIGFADLLQTDSPQIKQVATRIFEKGSAHKGLIDAMIHADKDVEELVLYLLNTVGSSAGRESLCRVLAARGTSKSLPQLKAMLEKEGSSRSSASRGAKYALEAIETRVRETSEQE